VKECVNFYVFRIKNGYYKGVKLDNLVFVLENSPSASRERPVANILYVGSASSTESDAIADFVKRSLGMSPANVVRTKITFKDSHKTLTVNIPNVLTYRISFQEDRLLSNRVGENLFPWLSDPKQGIASSVTYTPEPGHFVTYSHTNALSAEFNVRVPRR